MDKILVLALIVWKVVAPFAGLYYMFHNWSNVDGLFSFIWECIIKASVQGFFWPISMFF